MRRSIALFAGLATLTAVAQAQPYYIRGGFSGWDASVEMTETSAGSGIYEGAVTGQVPGSDFEFKCATADWSIEAPVSGGNLRARVNQAGKLEVRFYTQDVWEDGWLPNTRRAGILNAQLEKAPGVWVAAPYILVGDLVEPQWSQPGIDAVIGGDGIRRAAVYLMNGKEYQAKFAGKNYDNDPGHIDWSFNVGERFSCNTDNIKYTPDVAGKYVYELDLPGGRYRTVAAFTKTISGTLDLGSFSGDPTTLTFNVEVRNASGDAVVETVPVHPDFGGNFKIGTIATGNVNLRVRGGTWITRRVNGIAMGAEGATGVMVSLVNGDCSFDDAIDSSDYFILSDAYDTYVGDAAYNEAADLNKDGTVDASDYFILSDGYDSVGDN